MAVRILDEADVFGGIGGNAAVEGRVLDAESVSGGSHPANPRHRSFRRACCPDTDREWSVGQGTTPRRGGAVAADRGFAQGTRPTPRAAGRPAHMEEFGGSQRFEVRLGEPAGQFRPRSLRGQDRSFPATGCPRPIRRPPAAGRGNPRRRDSNAFRTPDKGSGPHCSGRWSGASGCGDDGLWCVVHGLMVFEHIFEYKAAAGRTVFRQAQHSRI